MNKDNFNFEFLDKPNILQYLFHPRKDESISLNNNVEDLLIPVEDDVSIGGRFFKADKKSPIIIFFHGNGEIVADYEDLGQMFTKLNINFFAVDYRGYGRSTGIPTVSSMMEDCHKVFKFFINKLKNEGFNGCFVMMGRSLGSASAMELVNKYPDLIDGLIIDSGFAFTIPLLKLLGINTVSLGIEEKKCFLNLEKIKKYNKPTLIIHAEFDHIIPYNDGKELYEKSPSKDKKLIKIENADHNTIFYYGIKTYIKEVKNIIEIIKK